MEFSQVSLTAYIGAAIMAWVLAAVYLLDWRHHRAERALGVAALVHGLNLALTGLTFSTLAAPPQAMLVVEALHYACWALALRTLLQHTGRAKLPRAQTLLFALPWPIAGVLLLAAITQMNFLFFLGTWISLALSVIALVCVEQTYRFATENNRGNKVIVISLGALFLYDTYLYSYATIFQQFDPMLWQSRAAVSIGVCLFMALGKQLLGKQSNISSDLSLSRPMAFYSTSLIAVGSLFMVLALGGYYVRIYSGNWGSVVYSLLVIGAVLLVFSMLVSRSLREQMSAIINKHLFRHKYDYRSEWLRLINFLSMPTDGSEAAQRAFLAATSITKASGGALWLKKSDHFDPVFQLALPTGSHPPKVDTASEFCRIMQSHEWVFLIHAKPGQSQAKYNELLPPWVINNKQHWLLLPLMAGHELVGFLLLCEPHNANPITWEDLDLFKTTGRQLGSYLKLHQQSEQLAENRQFDTFNKLVAFIVHDINNVIAQQSLVVKNAEKHKHKPEFVDDAMHTIDNSVERMRQLLKKLSPGANELVQKVKIHDAVRLAIDESKQSRSKINKQLDLGSHWLMADQVRLVMTISHFIKNAVDATAEQGEVRVTMTLEPARATILIEDTGHGMDSNFIQHRLFKPFDTTKSGKGMGIGAYLSREYIKELGGTLEVSSKIGEGTQVVFTLPVQSTESEKIREASRL
ncbi:XrtA/PEP-CTERM system histidine kinase PrsK [Simiduia agarivorans]|uniref:histidine kinase n=1 Tax=Simiduia agarivorans (strain DSM 21679 / JCM 13881 / BCRC 17597 / SA1) TaxID=1117647 RepID=K4KIT6_SIMAS|nr:XrtA/PEP-CTERM system histidine kinase PrsK [Simiduia agarivorans]AFU98941.1 two-component signal transduction histidine kinase [Simiduia agarivorans SA1 = DSM 21679]